MPSLRSIGMSAGMLNLKPSFVVTVSERYFCISSAIFSLSGWFSSVSARSSPQKNKLTSRPKAAVLLARIIILDPHDVVFSQIGAELHFDENERFFPRVL